MELQLSLPSGNHSLFAATDDTSLTKVCPQGTGFQLRPDSITHQNHFIFTSLPTLMASLKINIKQIGKTGDWENFGGVKYEFSQRRKTLAANTSVKTGLKEDTVSYERVGTLENQNVREVS